MIEGSAWRLTRGGLFSSTAYVARGRNRSTMKLFVGVGVFLLEIFAGTSYATVAGINVTSQQHSIYGAVAGMVAIPVTDTQPLNYYFSDSSGWLSGDIGNFQMTIAAGETSPSDYSCVTAASTYYFLPLSSELQLTATASGYAVSSINLQLIDLTEGTTLFDIWHPLSWSGDYAVDPAHSYKLWYTAQSGDENPTVLNVGIVPEPATVALLGLGALLLIKRRK